MYDAERANTANITKLIETGESVLATERLAWIAGSQPPGRMTRLLRMTTRPRRAMPRGTRLLKGGVQRLRRNEGAALCWQAKVQDGRPGREAASPGGRASSALEA